MSKVLSQELGIQRHREICPFPEVIYKKLEGQKMCLRGDKERHTLAHTKCLMRPKSLMRPVGNPER